MNTRAGRPVDTQRRARTLESATDWVMQHGLAGLSLRPLATALETSPRMLLYDFGDKDGLVRAILQRIQERQAERVRAQLAMDPSPEAALESLWNWLNQPEQVNLVDLMLDIRCQILGGRLPVDLMTDWNEPFHAFFDQVDAPREDLVLIRAVMSGLLMERRLADPELIDGAMKRFLGVVRKA